MRLYVPTPTDGWLRSRPLRATVAALAALVMLCAGLVWGTHAAGLDSPNPAFVAAMPDVGWSGTPQAFLADGGGAAVPIAGATSLSPVAPSAPPAPLTHNPQSLPLKFPQPAASASPSPQGFYILPESPLNAGGSVFGGADGTLASSLSGQHAPYDPAVVSYIQADFPSDQWGNAEKVSECESGMSNSVGARNTDGSYDWGVFQLNDGGTLQGLLREFGYPTSNIQQALNAEWNVKAAALLWHQRGWEPWTCARLTGVYP